MKITNPIIKQLLAHYKEISLVSKIQAVLDWDLNVNLPPMGAEGRGMQSAYLAKLLTRLWLDENFRNNVKQANTLTSLSTEEQAIVRNLNSAGKYYFQVPPELIGKKEAITTKAFVAWREARTKNDYQLFLPFLKELLAIDKLIAKHIGYKQNLYDALLDLYEPGLTATFCEKIFDEIKPSIIALVKKIQKSKSYTATHALIDGKNHYPLPDQKKLGSFMMRKMGFDFTSGRVDESAHPFTTELDRSDIRMTTAFQKNDFRSSYTAYMHETGHALYEQGINRAFSQTPLEGGASFGIHEALSRFWENMVGKNPEFLRFLTPVFQGFYPEQLSTMSNEEMIKLFHIVKPSFIRIEADEVTYSLHIILRFEMENGLLNGTIKPEDAPEVWRQKSKEYFGITPPTDSDGILQDVHWSYGAFGYFPSYALGNLYGAQLLAKMKKDFAFDEELAKGKLAKTRAWLQDEVHHYGSVYLPGDLIKKATHEKLNPKYFITYLEEKYNKIYS